MYNLYASVTNKFLRYDKLVLVNILTIPCPGPHFLPGSRKQAQDGAKSVAIATV